METYSDYTAEACSSFFHTQVLRSCFEMFTNPISPPKRSVDVFEAYVGGGLVVGFDDDRHVRRERDNDPDDRDMGESPTRVRPWDWSHRVLHLRSRRGQRVTRKRTRRVLSFWSCLPSLQRIGPLRSALEMYLRSR